MNSGSRIVANVTILYVRIGIGVLISLVNTRLVLGALGKSDFGLFAVLGSAVGFVGFLNGIMASSTQRHIAFELGKGDIYRARQTFNTCFIVHLAIGGFVIVAGEAVGHCLLEWVLSVPPQRYDAARWVLHAAIVSSACGVAGVPFQAVFTAREAMGWIASIELMQIGLTTVLAASLDALPGDHLVWYGWGSATIQMTSVLASGWLCQKTFAEARFLQCRMFVPQIGKEVISFSFWNIIGSVAQIARSAGFDLLINRYHGTAVNAGLGIANQVTLQLGAFSTAFLRAVNPQFAKREAIGRRADLIRLSTAACKYSLLLGVLLAGPLLLEMDTLLKIWLVDVPPHALEFCRLSVVVFCIDRLTFPIMGTVQAVGRIAAYQTCLGGLLLLNLPLAWVVLHRGAAPSSILITSAVVSTVAGVARLLFARRLVGIDLLHWSRVVLVPSLLVVGVVALVSLWMSSFPSGSGRAMKSIPLALGLGTLATWRLALNRAERIMVIQLAGSLRQRLKKWYR